MNIGELMEANNPEFNAIMEMHYQYWQTYYKALSVSNPGAVIVNGNHGGPDGSGFSDAMAIGGGVAGVAAGFYSGNPYGIAAGVMGLGVAVNNTANDYGISIGSDSSGTDGTYGAGTGYGGGL